MKRSFGIAALLASVLVWAALAEIPHKFTGEKTGGVTKAKLNENFEALQKQVNELRAAARCEKPHEECVCRTDGGSDRAKIVVCFDRCPDGRFVGFEIRHIEATSERVSCDDPTSIEPP